MCFLEYPKICKRWPRIYGLSNISTNFTCFKQVDWISDCLMVNVEQESIHNQETNFVLVNQFTSQCLFLVHLVEPK